jgi:hypothetical protein
MRTIKTALITLAASTAILVPATSAAAATQSTSTAASSSVTSAKCIVGLVGCFDLYVNDVLSDNDVDIITAIDFCGVQVQVLGIGQFMDCGDGKKVHRKS